MHQPSIVPMIYFLIQKWWRNTLIDLLSYSEKIPFASHQISIYPTAMSVMPPGRSSYFVLTSLAIDLDGEEIIVIRSERFGP